MKKLLLFAAMTTLVCGVYAQGVVSMNTLSANGPRATNGLTLQPLGLGQPSGTFLAQLYYAAGADNLGSLQSVTNAPATFGTSASAAGYISGSTGGGNRILDVVGPITVQIRVWSAIGGATYEAAVTAASGNPLIIVGASARLNSTATFGSPQPAPGAITGPGYIVGVPEPSTIALGLLGLGAIALFRRRK